MNDPHTTHVGSNRPPELRPSGVPKVFGVLSIVFSSLLLASGLMWGCLCVGTQVLDGFASEFSGNGPDAEHAELIMTHMGEAYFWQGVQGIVLALVSAVLLPIGIGQVRYRRWARHWTIYWSWLALATLVGLIVLSFVVIAPAFREMLDAVADSSVSDAHPLVFPRGLGGVVGAGMSVTLLVFYAPYPILLLIYFTRDRVRAAMNR